MTRKQDLNRFYELLERLREKCGGHRKLKNCNKNDMEWPERGVYFFMSRDETREGSGRKRVTRVGTHAVREDSEATLWERLRTHRGTKSGNHPGGGNHRGSVFRLRVGEAIIRRNDLQDYYPTWGEGSTAESEIRDREYPMEQRVSDFIQELPFLWLKVDDEPGPESDRDFIERNAVALLSNFEKKSIDARSGDWLGKHSPSREIRESGLWNVDYVEKGYDSDFMDLMEKKIESWEK